MTSMTALVEPDLAGIGQSLVERLGGRWSGRGGMCRCPAHDDRSPSLSIRLGNYGLFYHCFAGCTALDVIRAVRLLDARVLTTGAVQSHAARSQSDRFQERLRGLWHQAGPVTGSPAERYLSGRALGSDFRGMRFHPRVPLGAGANLCFRPAILAAVQDGPDLLALHRTFLTSDGTRLAPDLEPPRRMLGRPGRGAVRLGRASAVLGIAEGLETAMSAMMLLGIPVWAALGNERLPHLTIPLGVRRLLILADDDPAGRRAAAAAAVSHAAPGRMICRLWPGRGFNDWNDRLRQRPEESCAEQCRVG
jgi:putative DNA primase/helicase